MLMAHRIRWTRHQAPPGLGLLWCLAVVVALARFGVGDALRDVHHHASADSAAASDFTGGLLGGLLPGEAPTRRAAVPEGGPHAISEYGDGGDNRKRDLSVCLLLIVRNEESNLRANLPLWRDVAACYVIGVDDRTTDGTVQAIGEVLDEDTPRFVFLYTFEDFSQARNAVLRSTSHHFSNASHVLFIDADWRPDLTTVDISELDFDHRSFQFLIWDSSGHTTRLAGWLLRNDERLRFKYRVHETLDPSVVSTSPSKLIRWEVRVVESDSSWHADLHGHSRTAERFLFDLKLLERDYQDDPTDLHTLFYLGITTYSYMETLIGKGTHEKTAELDTLVTNGMSYFRQAVDLYGEHSGLEFVWSSIRWLAYGYHYFIGDDQEAEKWYRECITYDPTRVDCVVFLSRLHLHRGNFDDAWEEAKVGLLFRSPMHRPLDYFYIYECFVPIQAATVISKRMMADSLGNDSIEGLLTLGWYLVQHHRDHCKHGVLVDTPEDIDRLGEWFEEAVQREGVDVAETRRLTLLSKEVPLLGVLLKTWGTGNKAMSFSKIHVPPVFETPGTTEELVEDYLPNLSNSSEDGNLPATEERKKKTVLRKTVAKVGEIASGWTSTSKPPLRIESDCEMMVQEARAQLELNGRAESNPRKPARGILAATNLAQINAALPAAAAPWTRYEKHPFRALVFGGGGAGKNKRGLDQEEMQHVISLLVELSASPLRFDVTYAHPDRPILEAAQALAARCPDELGIAGGSLQFVHSTLDEFLDTTIDLPFNYVDIGGPLAQRDTDRVSADDKGVVPTVLSANILKRVGAKLTPGAYLRVWAFAENPSTAFVFRTAAKMTTPSDTANEDNILLHKVMRKTFGAGPSSTIFAGNNDEAASTELDTETVSKEFVAAAGEPTEYERELAKATEDAWVQQVLAGGDRLLIADIDNVLLDGGFKLTLMLGNRIGQYNPEGVRTRSLAGMAELVEGSMSRWEMADFADALEPIPVLVHQAVAVWQGGTLDST